mmetsp:Transcript_23614/g.27116  ORF Transcript_23614/g.27116 Transcript_23614/m.27116 type:complete len:80 (-) Transcript_23614:244-483(-)
MKRGLFRSFSAFYKNKFAKYIKKFNNLRCTVEKKNAKMEEYVNAFIQEHFEEYFHALDLQDQTVFVLKLKEILFSNRYK